MAKKGFLELAREGVIGGIFWSVGVTLGFVIVTLVIAFLAGNLITVPVIGNAIADIVRATMESLSGTTN